MSIQNYSLFLRIYTAERGGKVRCRFWRDDNITDGGICTHGYYGGKPSFGTCRVCPHYRGRPRGWGDVFHSLAQPLAKILNASDRRMNRPLKFGRNCRCAQRRREWNNRYVH